MGRAVYVGMRLFVMRHGDRIAQAVIAQVQAIRLCRGGRLCRDTEHEAVADFRPLYGAEKGLGSQRVALVAITL